MNGPRQRDNRLDDTALRLGRRVALSSELKQGLTAFIRKGSSQERIGDFLNVNKISASMQVGSNPDGGWTVIPELEKAIRTLSREIGVMRSVASVREMTRQCVASS